MDWEGMGSVGRRVEVGRALASEAGFEGLWDFGDEIVLCRSPAMLTGLGEVGIIERKFCGRRSGRCVKAVSWIRKASSVAGMAI